MLHPLVRILALWCAIFLGATACGSLTQSANDTLSVKLQAPDGEDSALFWYGVTQKALLVTPAEGEPVTLPWEDGKNPGVELHRGDQLTFQGTDRDGVLKVTGETRVGEEKNITIPLRRVL